MTKVSFLYLLLIWTAKTSLQSHAFVHPCCGMVRREMVIRASTDGEGENFAHKNNDDTHTHRSTSSIIGREMFLRQATVPVALLTSSMPIFVHSPPSMATNLPPTNLPAPYFELPNSRGGITTLTNLTSDMDKKTWTILYFYPGAFTSGCTLEARGFQRDLQSYRQLNAQIFGISVDPLEKNAQFCKEERIDFDLLSDPGGKVSKLYGSSLSIPGFGTFSNRQTYIIDPNGNLRWVFTDVESHVARHSTEVLEKMNELVRKEI